MIDDPEFMAAVNALSKRIIDKNGSKLPAVILQNMGSRYMNDPCDADTIAVRIEISYTIGYAGRYSTG